MCFVCRASPLLSFFLSVSFSVSLRCIISSVDSPLRVKHALRFSYYGRGRWYMRTDVRSHIVLFIFTHVNSRTKCYGRSTDNIYIKLFHEGLDPRVAVTNVQTLIFVTMTTSLSFISFSVCSISIQSIHICSYTHTQERSINRPTKQSIDRYRLRIFKCF